MKQLVPRSPPLPLGTTVKPYGEIGAIVLTRGERYYMLTDKRGTVSLMPWFVIEQPDSANEPR